MFVRHLTARLNEQRTLDVDVYDTCAVVRERDGRGQQRRIWFECYVCSEKALQADPDDGQPVRSYDIFDILQRYCRHCSRFHEGVTIH